VEWATQHLTKRFLRELKNMRDSRALAMSYGAALNTDSIDSTGLSYARSVGVCEGIEETIRYIEGLAKPNG